MSDREIGELEPVRKVLGKIDAMAASVAEVQPSDSKLEVLRSVRAWLAAALDEAANPEAVLTADELAERYDVKLATVYKWKQRGKLPGAKKQRGRLVIPVSSVAA